ncbi:MAG: protein adenylyltransferase SelO family protein, partial [Candidatus Binatia bacterium]
MPLSPHYAPAPRFDRLGDGFFDVVEPARFPQHLLRFRNDRCAARLGLGDLDGAEWERHFARFEPLPRNLEKPLAMRYHGHQFGVYNPHLGDGRAFLFAQLLDAEDGRLLDLGTKGSGRTPWSRDGDGRLTLKGGVREVLASEMLEALGVKTSKALSLFETGESLYRGDEPSPTRSSVLVRVGHSHVRFGTFQRYAFHEDRPRLRRLLEHVIESSMPELASDAVDAPSAFFREVCARSAELVASWMAAGFVHGVLNTDNMNVNGESFDYGPYRFLPTWDPEFVAAYFDPGGYYAFGRQPEAVRWNLAALAEALTPLSAPSELRPVWEGFGGLYRSAFHRRFLARLGLEPRGAGKDSALVEAACDFLAGSQVG